MSKRPGDPGYAARWCIHYRRPGNLIGGHDSCEAGVAYSTFDGTKFDVRPCFLTETGESKYGSLPCQHLRRPTAEEIAAHEGWVAGRMAKLVTVMTGIQAWRDAHKGRSGAEVVPCPACAGRLHLSISGSNGHVHGRCETPGCVSWME